MKKFYKVRKRDRVELNGGRTVGVYEVNAVYYSENSVYVGAQIIHLYSLTGLNSKIVGPFRDGPEITKIF